MTTADEIGAPVRLEVCISSKEKQTELSSLITIKNNSELMSIYICNKQGKFKAMVVCFVLGLGSLVAWSSMLIIEDYYYQLFPVSSSN
jgi:uncharacterized membrane protein (GlpM family)